MKGRMMPRISYQLYCSRNFPPVADTMKMLAEAGFAEVEGYGGLLGDPAALKAALPEGQVIQKTKDHAAQILETA